MRTWIASAAVAAAVISCLVAFSPPTVGLPDASPQAEDMPRAVALNAAPATPACDAYAHPSGSDSAPATKSSPVRTIGKLVSGLDPGEVGCLASGQVFTDDVSISKSGTRSAPIRIQSAPGSPAIVRGKFVIGPQAHDIVVDGLVLDGSQNPDFAVPFILGDRITFTNNDVSNGNEDICFLVGQSGDLAEDVRIDSNRIHHCGELPATNRDHGIYLENTVGAVVTNNYIYENADWGVHLYPNAQKSLIANNVIDRNGSGIIFGGGNGYASSDNVVTRNIISHSKIKHDVQVWWPSGNPVGTGNVVYENCIYGGRQGEFDPRPGYREWDNVIQPPGFVDDAQADYRLLPDSPCKGMGPQPPSVGPSSPQLQTPPSPPPGGLEPEHPGDLRGDRSAGGVSLDGRNQDATRTCGGRVATILGSPGDDVIAGTDGPDVIVTLGGNDLIRAGGGNDIVCSGAGDDLVSGGPQHDLVYGGAGKDRLRGYTGNDSLRGGSGADRIRGGPGQDFGTGQQGNDRLDGGPGSDVLYGARGADALQGRGGNDYLISGPGPDVLIGGTGSDHLDGQAGRDRLSGGTERDRVIGGLGLDVARGGKGRDACSSERTRLCESAQVPATARYAANRNAQRRARQLNTWLLSGANPG